MLNKKKSKNRNENIANFNKLIEKLYVAISKIVCNMQFEQVYFFSSLPNINFF